MTQRTYRIRIADPSLPSGAIAAADLAEIAKGLQTIANRIARGIVGASGRGRSPATLEQTSRLLITGLSHGSTIIEATLGDASTLDLPGGVDEQLGIQFDAVVAGIATNTPPVGTPPLVADAARQLSNRLRVNFPDARIEIALPDRTVSVDGIDLDSTVWRVRKDLQTQHVQVTGKLFLVDVRSNMFRIEDAVGNDITLLEVADADDSKRLIGHVVTASGDGEYRSGKLSGVVAPTIVPFEAPTFWTTSDELLHISLTGRFGEGIEGVTQDEIEAFLAQL